MVNDEIKETIKQAEVNAKKMIDNVDSCLIHFNEYGSNFLKSGMNLFFFFDLLSFSTFAGDEMGTGINST